jgi:O-antigen/teichoic acid export membrane protein
MAISALAAVQPFWAKIKARKGSTNAMILFLSVSNVIGNALTIVSGLFVAKWLLPEELGSFNGFNIIVGYVVLAQLGIPSALNRELPYYYGKNEKAIALRYAAVAQYWQKYLGLVALIVGILAAIYFYATGKNEWAAGLLVIGFSTWQTLYVTKYLNVLYRTNRDFNKLSWIKLINAGTAFVSIIFVWLFGFYGLCLRAIIGAVVDFGFSYYWRPIKVKAEWDKLLFKNLMNLGLPMFGVANIYSLWPLVQRTLIISLGGTKSLGLFALAVMVENAMKTVSNSMSSVVYPAMASKWGEGATVREVIQLVIKPITLGFVLFAFAVPVGWWLLPIFVDSFIPNYREGVEAAQWMLLVGLLSLTNVFSNIYNVIKNQKDRLKVFISGIGMWGIMLGILFFFKGFSLMIFPQSMLAAYAAMMLLNFLHLRRDWSLDSRHL